jgi:hypothetical protein
MGQAVKIAVNKIMFRGLSGFSNGGDADAHNRVLV